MGEEKKQKVIGKKVSRRGFLKGAAVAAGTAGLVGFPAVMRVSAQAAIKIKMQTCWDAGTVGFVEFQKFCKYVGEITEGKLTVEGFSAGAIVGTFEMFDAWRAPSMQCTASTWHWPGKCLRAPSHSYPSASTGRAVRGLV
jgi:TRAP-type mannitol/chloroaromatic compound transport system substrate-binding protein